MKAAGKEHGALLNHARTLDISWQEVLKRAKASRREYYDSKPQIKALKEQYGSLDAHYREALTDEEAREEFLRRISGLIKTNIAAITSHAPTQRRALSATREHVLSMFEHQPAFKSTVRNLVVATARGKAKALERKRLKAS